MMMERGRMRRDEDGDVVMGDGPEPEMVPLPASPLGERV
jgi:hypothetical protein